MPLKLIIGPMFAGKTSLLLDERKKESNLGRSCLVIKSSKDNRYSHDCVVSHNGDKTEAVSVDLLKDAQLLTKDYQCIFIDEGHFYDDGFTSITSWLDMGKSVFVTTLNGHSDRSDFNIVSQLVPHSDQVVVLSAICNKCDKKKALFTCRRNNESTNIVGGSETYVVLCRDCYLSR